jgi:calcineurin-like phosphoesterase family protein
MGNIMNEIFFTADCHFSHPNVVLHCDRSRWIYPNSNYDPAKPYHFKSNNPKAVNMEQHDNDLVDNWNSIVGKKDTVYILGDLAWRNHSHFIMRLNGSPKFLLRGNHDKMNGESYNLFAELGGARYQYSFFTQIQKQHIMLSHCPYESWFSSCHGSWNLHGHSHGRMKERVDMLRVDVGVDCWGYFPVPWDVIVKKMKIKEQMKKEFFGSNCHRDSNNSDSNINLVDVQKQNIQLMIDAGIIGVNTIPLSQTILPEYNMEDIDEEET